MSRLSEDRISTIAHRILDNLIARHLIDPTRRGEVLTALKRGFEGFEEFHEMIERRVKEKIASMSKKVPEGSEEWKLLYARLRDELLKKQRLGSVKAKGAGT